MAQQRKSIEEILVEGQSQPMPSAPRKSIDELLAVPSHPKAPPTTWDAVKTIADLLPFSPGMKTGAKAAYAELTNPDNLSTAGGAAGGALGGLAGGAAIGGPIGAPIGAVLGAFAGGTAASKFGEGKDWGPAMQEGAGEAIFEGGMPLVGRGVAAGAHALSRRLTGAALNPTNDVLGQMRNPITNRPFRTPGEAARQFRTDATAALDDVPGSPGGITYAHGLQDVIRQARDLKMDALRNSPTTLTSHELISPGAFDALLAQLGRESGNANAAGPMIDDAVIRSLGRSQMVPSTRSVMPGKRPDMTPPDPFGRWDMTEIDARLQGLDKDLDNFFSQRNMGDLKGQRTHPGPDEEATAIIRRELAQALAGNANPAQNGQTVAELNRVMQRNIPLADAASWATRPTATEGMPRIRVAGTPSNPSVQMFDYFRRGVGHAARPARVLGKGAEATAAQSPQLARLLQMLLQSNPESVQPSGTANMTGFGGG